jgi:predicted hotdog family 3-hydroxylacyl-ACP dehydratase
LQIEKFEYPYISLSSTVFFPARRKGRTIMSQTRNRPEDFLPHRDRMRLIDEIIEVNEKSAVTQATVTDQWPFLSGESVNSLVLIELVAQTAGISNCWEGIRKHGEGFVTKGWLVGVKQSDFHIHDIPLNTLIITRTENLFIFENFIEILGTVEIGSRIAAEIRLQLVQSETP